MATIGSSLVPVALVMMWICTPFARSERMRSMPTSPGTKYGLTIVISRDALVSVPISFAATLPATGSSATPRCLSGGSACEPAGAMKKSKCPRGRSGFSGRSASGDTGDACEVEVGFSESLGTGVVSSGGALAISK
jgi:hypothetical protein